MQWAQKMCINGLIQQMTKILTGFHKRAGFPGWEELFTAVNSYLVIHSPKGYA